MRVSKALLFTTALLSAGLTSAEKRYPRLVPNAETVVVNGVRAVGLGHPTLTATSDRNNPNQFGIDLENAIRAAGGEGNAQAVWSRLCDLDSDGDGILNKDELCDPNCNQPGQNPACIGDANLTHPGFFNNVDGSTVVPDAGFDSTVKLHAALMFLAWVVLAPFGILRAVFFKKMPGKPTWFRDHKYALMGTVVLTVLGFFAILSYEGFDGIKEAFDEGSSDSATHVRIGVVVLVLTVVQPISGFLRVHMEKGQPKTTFRLLWEFQHQWTGRLAVILGVVAVGSGFPLLSDDNDAFAAIIVAVMGIVGIGSFGYVLGYRDTHVAQVKAKQEAKSSLAPYATEAQQA